MWTYIHSQRLRDRERLLANIASTRSSLERVLGSVGSSVIEAVWLSRKLAKSRPQQLGPVAAHAGSFQHGEVCPAYADQRSPDQHRLQRKIKPIRKIGPDRPREASDCGDNFVVNQVHGIANPAWHRDPAIREQPPRPAAPERRDIE